MKTSRSGLRTGVRRLCQLLVGLTLPVSVTSCVDFGVDGDNYVCRTQDECASGMKCGAGPSCVCQCLRPEQIPNANCADPNCENPQTLGE